MANETYTIIRHFFNGERQTIKNDLTLEEAQEHCSDSETASNTATSTEAKRLTEEKGEWFDGYYKE